MRRSFLIIVLSLWLGSAPALMVQRYGASEHESRWAVSASPVSCSLSQEIPLYGRAVFEQQAGGELGMWLEVKRRPRDEGLARLLSVAPSWRHDTLTRDLGQVKYTVAQRAFRFDPIQSRRLLSELEQGMFPTLSYQDWADGRDEVQVALSAVNLRTVLDEFLDCMSGQLPYGFDQVRASRLFFESGKSTLGAREKQRLDEVAGYLLADQSVNGVMLEGRTDNRGLRRVNERLSRQRAEAVRDYLVSKGVSRSLITISTSGEREPLASNRTTEGRAQNRLVEVTLLK